MRSRTGGDANTKDHKTNSKFLALSAKYICEIIARTLDTIKNKKKPRATVEVEFQSSNTNNLNTAVG
jgi:hypothetical protein